MENRWVTLIAATTENPYFSVISPLLSRSLLLTLRAAHRRGHRAGCCAARSPTSAGWPARSTLDRGGRGPPVRMAGGDARRALTALEAAAGAALEPRASDGRCIDLATREAVDRAAVRYDRDGDQHYDVASALIKSIRGSDVDAALHYLARMIEAGEDPRFIARRLDDLRQRGHRHRRPDRAADRRRRGAGGRHDRHSRRRGSSSARRPSPWPWRPSRTPPTWRSARRIADVRAGLAGPVPPHLRDGHYKGADQARPRQGLRVPARPARRHRRPAVRPGRASTDGSTTGPPIAGSSAIWARGSAGCARSCADVEIVPTLRADVEIVPTLPRPGVAIGSVESRWCSREAT